MVNLQQFNYSRSLVTNRGTVERGKIHSARAMKQNDRHVDRLTDSVNMIKRLPGIGIQFKAY